MSAQISQKLLYKFVEYGNHWKNNFPESYQFWQNQAKNPEFWETCARICKSYGVPPEMACILVKGFVNDNPRDPSIQFHNNIMRAGSLIERSFKNCENHIKSTLKDLSNVASYLKEDPPEYKNIWESYREIARYSLKYFDILCDLITSQISASKKTSEISPQIRDSIRYKCCKENPFFLIGTAQTPRMRTLAGSNAFTMANHQPWTFSIWEGICTGNSSLTDVEGLIGEPSETQVFENGWGYAWPTNPFKCLPIPFDKPNPELNTPVLLAESPIFDSRADQFLSIAAEKRKRGLTI